MPDTDSADPAPPTRRSAAKADRRARLLREAASLVAERGFAAVRLDDLGAAVGISGPAVYRYFPTKDALLAELLVEISDRLLAGGLVALADVPDPDERLEALVRFHLEFSLHEPDLIRIQDRELPTLAEEPSRHVRRTQRRYVDIWVETLRDTDPSLSGPRAQTAVQATFGLLNSTPYSAGAYGTDRQAPQYAGDLLATMALAALRAATPTQP